MVVDGAPTAYRDEDEFELAVSAGASIAARAVRDEMETTALVSDQLVDDQPRLAQHPQVPADGRAGDREPRRDRASRHRRGPQHLQDLSTHAIADGCDHPRDRRRLHRKKRN